MSSRFITNLVVLTAGGFVVVASQAFSAGTTGWIAFGVAIGILAVTAVAQRFRGRGRVQTALDGLVGALAVWTAVASMVFSGATLIWVSFGNAVAFAALALAGLAAHELSTERVMHTFASAEQDNGRALAPAERYSAAA